MEKKTETLDKEVVEKLSKIQNEQDNMVIALGQVAVRRRELTKQMDELSSKEEEFGERLDKSINELNLELGELDKKYPNGQIDLEKGTVLY
jgi:aromatic ring-opening dioxygenase catalytic subunit (LigB family)